MGPFIEISFYLSKHFHIVLNTLHPDVGRDSLLLTAPHCSLSSLCSQVLIVDLCADKFVVQVCTQRRGVFAGNGRCGSRWPCLHLSPVHAPAVCVCVCVRNVWRVTQLLFCCTPAEEARSRIQANTDSSRRRKTIKESNR